MFWGVYPIFAIAVFFATWIGTGWVLRGLERRAILDHPNERSSHAVPTPRGGGLVLVPVVLVAWAAIAALSDTLDGMWPVLVASSALAIVSWRDDLHGLGPAPRLATQIVAVAIGVFALPGAGQTFQGLLPPLLDGVVTAVIWLWFINIFNFMDGIDGISGAEAACIGGGLLLFALIGGWGSDTALYGLTVFVAALGFLRWNWQPARIFLGDVGSVPLGYCIGWMLLGVAADGHWSPALLLPLYYLADATFTLARRLVRGERIWRAHREHFYQRAVRRGLSHAAVVRAMLFVNVVLVVCASLSFAGPGFDVAGIVFALLMVSALLRYFRGATKTPDNA
jgi:UDP-N-acetylmuramyl pentapeptide phosphotransferase/UDP-N-acetylglucosamine-1-phosphate transferase